jgi:hypothetical protein
VIDDDLLLRFIDAFVGYGNVAAPYWFIGMEEGGDSSNASLVNRVTVWRDRGARAVEDLRDYHLATGLSAFLLPGARLQPTWKQLIRITLLAQGQPVTPQTMRAYQAHQLGRLGGETALFELYPLPATSLNHWPYASLSTLPMLRDRKTYRAALTDQRCRLMGELIDTHRPRVVIMYGATYRNLWARIAGPLQDIVAPAGVAIGLRGASRMLAIQHPGAWGATDAYFDAIGRYVHDSCGKESAST